MTRPSANVVTKRAAKPKPTRKELCEFVAKNKFETDLKNALNTKSTATFSLHSSYYNKDGREAIFVWGEVTAQNTFGAMITEKVDALYVMIGDAAMLAQYCVGNKNKVVSVHFYEEALEVCDMKAN